MTNASAPTPSAPSPPSTSFRPISIWQKIFGFRLIWPGLALLLLLGYNALFTAGFFKLSFLSGAAPDSSTPTTVSASMPATSATSEPAYTPQRAEHSFLDSITSDHFSGSLISILQYGTPVAILAIGMTLVIGTGGVDLSVGSVMAISGGVAAVLINEHGWPFFAAAAAAIFVAVLVGVWNGVLVSVVRLQPIIATLVTMVAGRGIAQKITGGQIITFNQPSYVALANGYFLYLPLGVTIVVFVFVCVALATRRTALGLALESVGDSPAASRYVGLRVKTIQISAYAISAACAAVAGMIDASLIRAADPIHSGVNLELDAIFSVVVGGTALAGGRFTLAGSILGAILLQTLGTTLISTKLFGRDILPQYLPLPKAVVIFAVCLLQSTKFRDAVLRPFRNAGRKGRVA